MKPKFIIVAIVSICSAGVAMAGEITGTGEQTGRSGKSICSYSGLEDWNFSSDVMPGVVQNFGRHPNDTVGNGGVSDDRANIPNHSGPATPGRACNPGYPGVEPS